MYLQRPRGAIPAVQRGAVNVVRGARKQRFVVVDRATINDSRLSFRARGLLAWMLDKPDGWRASAEAISDATTEGRDAIRTALRELEDAGYLARRKYRGPAGRWEAEMVVFETPQEPDEADSPERDSSAGERQPPQPDSSAGQPSPDFQASRDVCTRGEDSIEHQTPSPHAEDLVLLPALPATPSPTELVFDAWISATRKRPGATKLDPNRRRIITGALKMFPLEDVVDAVRGWDKCPFNRGENDRRTVYNQLHNLIGDAAKVEKFRDYQRGDAAQAPPKMSRSFDTIARGVAAAEARTADNGHGPTTAIPLVTRSMP